MPFRILLLLTSLCGSIFAIAQSTAPGEPGQAVDSSTFVETAKVQFGPGYKVDPKFSAFVADFDGDGKEDLGLVVGVKDALGNSAKFEYKVVDPYNSYFGFGDVTYTTRFSSFGDGTNRCVAIVFDWKAAKPKGKFVIVNFPFSTLAVQYNSYKKKSVAAFYGREETGLTNIVFWDGKKWRWEPGAYSESEDMAK
jgi:hypothetical protein